MQFESTQCILCEELAERQAQDALNTNFFYSCPNCGKFFASDDFIKFSPKENHALLSGFVNYENKSNKYPQFKTDNINLFLSHPIMPKSLLDKADKLLLYYFDLTHYYSESIPTSLRPAVCFAKNQQELFGLYTLLESHQLLGGFYPGMMRNDPKQKLFVTSTGFRRCEELRSASYVESTTAFVAMWFGKDMHTVYEKAIAPAIEECGYVPVRVDNIEHNNDITDEIIAGIRESRFVVADMTGYRGGVYYEAGFAHGLGLPVIFTCRRDWFDGETDGDRVIKERIHFDINHQNIIVWDNVDDLKDRIINRIRATIL